MGVWKPGPNHRDYGLPPMAPQGAPTVCQRCGTRRTRTYEHCRVCLPHRGAPKVETPQRRLEAALALIDEMVSHCADDEDPTAPRPCESFCENFGHHTLLKIAGVLRGEAQTDG